MAKSFTPELEIPGCLDIIADRFHLMKQVNDELDAMRKSEKKAAMSLPGFLTKKEKIGVKNCQNLYCTNIPAVKT